MGRGEARVMGAPALSGVIGFLDATTAGNRQGAGVVCTAFPADPGFSGASGSAAMARGPGLQAQPPLFPWFCLLYLFHPSLNVQICGIIWHPGVLDRGAFFELWMFYWL